MLLNNPQNPGLGKTRSGSRRVCVCVCVASPCERGDEGLRSVELVNLHCPILSLYYEVRTESHEQQFFVK